MRGWGGGGVGGRGGRGNVEEVVHDPSMVERIDRVGGAARFFYWGVPPVSTGVFLALLRGIHKSKVCVGIVGPLRAKSYRGIDETPLCSFAYLLRRLRAL